MTRDGVRACCVAGVCLAYADADMRMTAAHLWPPLRMYMLSFLHTHLWLHQWSSFNLQLWLHPHQYFVHIVDADSMSQVRVVVVRVVVAGGVVVRAYLARGGGPCLCLHMAMHRRNQRPRRRRQLQFRTRTAHTGRHQARTTAKLARTLVHRARTALVGLAGHAHQRRRPTQTLTTAQVRRATPQLLCPRGCRTRVVHRVPYPSGCYNQAPTGARA